MKAVVCMMALAVVGMGLTGCTTLAESPGENFNRIARTTTLNGQQIPTDVERLLLLDHPSYLSKIPTPSN
jgi:hypothetical protein